MKLSDRYDVYSLGMDILGICESALTQLREKGRRLETNKTKDEIVTEADNAIEQAVIDYLKENSIPVNLDGEEKRRTIITKNPLGLITLDPIDGTFNYYRGELPYCTIVTIFDSPEPKTLGDGIWAGIAEHTTGKRIYLYENRVMLKSSNSLTFSSVATSKRTSLEKKVGEEDANVMLDLGPKKSLKYYQPFAEIIQSSWTKNISCAGMHLAGVACGAFDAYISPVQKPEELVAGILLIEKAGGAVITLDGKRAGDLPYDFNARYKIIASATQELAEEIRDLIIQHPTSR